jgi:hypothetical protein
MQPNDRRDRDEAGSAVVRGLHHAFHHLKEQGLDGNIEVLILEVLEALQHRHHEGVGILDIDLGLLKDLLEQIAVSVAHGWLNELIIIGLLNKQLNVRPVLAAHRAPHVLDVSGLPQLARQPADRHHTPADQTP